MQLIVHGQADKLGHGHVVFFEVLPRLGVERRVDLDRDALLLHLRQNNHILFHKQKKRGVVMSQKHNNSPQDLI